MRENSFLFFDSTDGEKKIPRLRSFIRPKMYNKTSKAAENSINAVDQKEAANKRAKRKIERRFSHENESPERARSIRSLGNTKREFTEPLTGNCW